MADEKKFAGYVCTGCGIGERLDASHLETTAKRDGKMAEVKQHEMLCSAEGVKMIRDDIDAGATHVMIAACSRRAKVEAFNFTDVAMSRANLREGVIWLRPESDENQETTQEMADDYIRMACAEVKYMTKPSPSGEQELNKTLLVVGGGATGMTSAIEAAKAGYPVHLVAGEAKLGGVWADLYKRVPFRAAAADVPNGKDVNLPKPEDPGLDAMAAEIEANDKITVHLSAKITKTSGAPGRFCADISTESGGTVTENFGAIVQANDYKPYDANKLPELATARPRTWSPTSSWKSWPRRPTAPHQAPVRRQGGQIRRLHPVRRSALQQGRPPALLLRLLLHRVHQAGHVLQGAERGLRRHRPVRRPAHPRRRRRGLLPRRPTGHGHLLQGQGLRGHGQR